jgi:hypothetical protein
VKTAVFHETRHAPDRAPYTLDTRRSGGSQASSGDARMKLAQAISLARDCDSQPGEPFRVFLACGFTPQHINVFLQAHLFSRLKNRRVVVDNGRYGDLAGSLAGLREDTRYDALIVLLEWSDLDARLGYRTTHGWRPDCVRDYPDTAAARLVQLRNLIEHLCARAALYLVLPTLPLPPAFLAATLRGDCLAFTLNERLMAFAATASAMPGVHVVNPHKVDALSPFDRRLDLASDVRAGFPYSLEHASLVCRLVSELIHPAARKKGIITDLDDTLWRGVLGEDGVDGVSWELSRLTHAHALYQEMLASLAEIGVLVAVATKNDPDLVERALGRQDLVIPREAIFPRHMEYRSRQRGLRGRQPPGACGGLGRAARYSVHPLSHPRRPRRLRASSGASRPVRKIRGYGRRPLAPGEHPRVLSPARLPGRDDAGGIPQVARRRDLADLRPAGRARLRAREQDEPVQPERAAPG